MGILEGVRISNLKVIPNEKGDILHALKVSDDTFIGFGEAYFSNVTYNEKKGWKKHKEMTLNLVVPVGEIRLVLFDDRIQSSTKGKFLTIDLSIKNYHRLTVPPGIWMAFMGIGLHQNILLNIADIEHRTEEAESLPIDGIEFIWEF